jgi:hypothetical protein
MVVVSDPDLSWAVTKAALVVVSALTSVVCLAWAGGRIAFPSESEEQRVEEKTTDSRPSSRARPRDANWPYGSEVAPRILGPIRKVLVAEFYLANIASSLWSTIQAPHRRAISSDRRNHTQTSSESRFGCTAPRSTIRL